MPTYEYACKTCGEHLEVVQSFKDDALTICPACGGQLRKVFGSIGIAFKGSGFYKNDSRAASSSASAKSSSSDSGSGSSGSSGSSDAGSSSTPKTGSSESTPSSTASSTKSEAAAS